jgi:hypothetical protein
VRLEKGDFVRCEPTRLADLFDDNPPERVVLDAHLALPLARDGAVPIQAVHRIVEVAHESVAAELAVGENLESKLFLAVQRAQDVLVFELGDLVRRGVPVLAGLQKLRRAKQTADVVGTVGKGHGYSIVRHERSWK